MKVVKKILLIFLLWRILLFVPVIIANRTVPYRPATGYTNLKDYTLPNQTLLPSDIRAWANFDGVLYLRIAGHGYTNEGRFFPFYPFLIRYSQYLFPDHQSYGPTQFFVGFFISNIAFFLSLVVLYKLLRLDYSEKIAWRTILYLLVFPTAFFYGALYTESLFLLFCLLSLYLARKKHWFEASMTAVILSVVRPIGLLILPALVVEFMLTYRNEWRRHVPNILYFLLIPTGLLAYAYYCLRKWGDSLYFLHAQAAVGNGRTVSNLVNPLQTIYRYFKIFIHVPINQYEWWIAAVELLTFLIICYLLYQAWKHKIRLSYLLFSALAFLIPVLSGTFTGLPRYVVVLFPVFIALTLMKNQWVKYTYVIISLIVSFLLLAAFSRGYFVA